MLHHSSNVVDFIAHIPIHPGHKAVQDPHLATHCIVVTVYCHNTLLYLGLSFLYCSERTCGFPDDMEQVESERIPQTQIQA